MKREKLTKQTISAGGIVINKKGYILIVNQRGTSWSLPKGHIDDGEDAIAAAKREIYEESGIRDLTFVRELGVYQRYKIGKEGGEDLSELKTIHLFLFKTEEELLNPIDPDNPEARWVKKEEVADILTHRKDKEFFLQLKDTL
jgi:ADP-ribose pyrophosphatase YjhB (NUDIX family)